MPMYDYRCPLCGAAFEQLVSFTRADEVPCPACGHTYAQRRISRVALGRSGESRAFREGASCAPSSGGT